MLSWVLTFLIIALIAGVLGFGGIAGASVEIAKAIFFIAIILFLISAVVGVVRQSSKSKTLLFAGTELGLYVTFDGGAKWHHLTKSGLPANVRVDDLVIHTRERDLVIGTHGRGIWIMDVAPLEQLTDKVLAADAHLFDVKPAHLFKQQKREMPATGAMSRIKLKFSLAYSEALIAFAGFTSSTV